MGFAIYTCMSYRGSRFQTEIYFRDKFFKKVDLYWKLHKGLHAKYVWLISVSFRPRYVKYVSIWKFIIRIFIIVFWSAGYFTTCQNWWNRWWKESVISHIVLKHLYGNCYVVKESSFVRLVHIGQRCLRCWCRLWQRLLNRQSTGLSREMTMVLRLCLLLGCL